MNGEVLVSVVIPMLDEIEFIGDCLDSFAGQDIGTDHLEILVVDGGSMDGSRELVDERAEREPWIRVLDNRARKASAAFNVGASAARGDVICLFSSHGVAARSYARCSVEALGRTGADGVGGRYVHAGCDERSTAIGLAMASPFGMGSPHRFATSAKEVDTISHPAYRADSLRKVLPFDESLMRNADYEMNWRMRSAGMRLWFDPDVVSIYRPRPHLAALSRQFWWYGRWKVRVMRQHPESFRLRHLAAPAAVTLTLASPLVRRTSAGRTLTSLAAVGYAAGALAAVARERPWVHRASPVTLALAFPTMHLSWGGGFLTSLVEDAAAKVRT